MARDGLISPFDIDDAGYFWLKGNLHAHTTNSDGKPSPQERLDGYVNQGYDFLCISDHYTITRIDTVSAPDDFVLVQGAEIHPENPFGGQTHHFLAYNIDDDMDSKRMPPQHVIDEVKRQGGSIWLAHPHWSSVNILRDTFPLHGLAGIEVFNTTCRCAGRGESSVHWDDWMDLLGHTIPALSNDDSHALESDNKDTYGGWNMVKVRERSAEAIIDALERGCAYASSGPDIRDIRLRRVDGREDGNRVVEASIRCSEAQSILAVFDSYGTEYRPKDGGTFEEAAFTLRPNARWVRFEIIAPDGTKAWSNPMDLENAGW